MPDPPEVRPPFVLLGVNDPKTGKSAFSLAGQEIPPVIRTSPGQNIRLTFENHMSADSTERCIDGRCQNMTNLHFHGLHVSPNAPQDDVLTMMAMPGQSLRYVVQIPLDQPPGLYWYHTHPHGESYQQSLDGMSGAIVIDGMERYVPEVRKLRERILILRDKVVEKSDPAGPDLRRSVAVSEQGCSTSAGVPERIFTTNGVLRPAIDIAPGERQFWRIVNASPDLYADLTIDAENFEVVAFDGMPLAFHDPKRRTELVSHVFLPPAGRVEAIVTGPRIGAHASLRTQCVDTGPDGDPNPAMTLADLVALPHTTARATPASPRGYAATYKPVSPAQIAGVENSPPDFTVTFTEDKGGFYINGKKFGMADPPMVTVPTGAYHHWRVVNDTNELHPFHIHQVHFLFYSQNRDRVSPPEWLDTVNVPVKGSVDLMMDFTDPIIRGVSLFHCHLLSHEDKGMMAKILFQ
ncbi:MAG TPA: multicopper oxidase domain-containing protein [Acidobacteriaceae bacterium]|nr:multicopper oxidase domain-containing protein [Acidobacteriaceae bacterium]